MRQSLDEEKGFYPAWGNDSNYVHASHLKPEAEETNSIRDDDASESTHPGTHDYTSLSAPRGVVPGEAQQARRGIVPPQCKLLYEWPYGLVAVFLVGS